MQNNSTGYSNQYGVDRFIKFGKSKGLQYNLDVPIEHINKRPVYSYSNPFDLLSLSPALWLDANDSSTITTVSGAVSEWRDKSGNNRHVSQGTTNSRPIITTGFLSGKDVVTFDGSNDFLSNNYSINGLTEVHIFCVGIPVNPSIDTWYLGTDYLFSPARGILLGQSPSLNQFLIDGRPQGGGYIRSGLSSIFAGANILYSFIGNTGMQVGANGLLGSFTSYSVSSIVSGPRFLLGTIAGSEFYNCRIAEVIVLTGNLTAENRDRIFGYLAHKWGLTANLPTNHPYKNSNPSAWSSIVNLNNWGVNSTRPKARARYEYSLMLDIKTLTPLAWYDASDVSTLTLLDTNRVSQWRDKSGNNWHAIENTASARPTYNQFQQNGLSLISCRGSGIGMTTSLSLSTPYTIVLVSRQQNAGTSRVIQSGTTNSLISPARTTHNAAFHVNSPVGSGAAIVGANVWTTVTMVIGGGTSEVWYNNINYGSGTHGNWGTFVIATRGIYNEDPQAEIAEIIIFNRRLSTEDRITIQEYILSKWGIN